MNAATYICSRPVIFRFYVDAESQDAADGIAAGLPVVNFLKNNTARALDRALPDGITVRCILAGGGE